MGERVAILDEIKWLFIMPRLFIVVADVSKAYESVNQDKLLSVMEDFFSSDKYLLEKFHRVVCTKKSLRVTLILYLFF